MPSDLLLGTQLFFLKRPFSGLAASLLKLKGTLIRSPAPHKLLHLPKFHRRKFLEAADPPSGIHTQLK